VVTTTSTSFVKLKTDTITYKNGDYANLTVKIKSSTGTCRVLYEARINDTVIASGNTTSTSYATFTTNNLNITNYSAPVAVDLYLRANTSSCTASNQNFDVTQLPTRMQAAKVAANAFVDVMGNSSFAGLVSFSDTASTDQVMLNLSVAGNNATLKNAINALNPSGSTCMECGLNNGVVEETSSRSRYPDANRFMVLLSDGQSNVGNSTSGAAYARNNNITVYTIGLGDNADATELTNVALLTYGKYYFAPDAATLLYIYQHIGQ